VILYFNYIGITNMQNKYLLFLLICSEIKLQHMTQFYVYLANVLTIGQIQVHRRYKKKNVDYECAICVQRQDQ